VPKENRRSHFKQYFFEVTNLMTYRQYDTNEDLDADVDDNADDDVIVANEVYRFSNPFKTSQVAARINFTALTIAPRPRCPRPVQVKQELPAPQVPVAQPLKRQLIIKAGPKAKKAKSAQKVLEIIDNDVIETAYNM